MREAFEAWAVKHGYDIVRVTNKRNSLYNDYGTESAWCAWSSQAERVRELEQALSLVRMSAGWQYMSDETRAVICAALKEPK